MRFLERKNALNFLLTGGMGSRKRYKKSDMIVFLSHLRFSAEINQKQQTVNSFLATFLGKSCHFFIKIADFETQTSFSEKAFSC